MRNTKVAVNSHKKNRVGRTLNHYYWRTAALKYVMKNGPTPLVVLLDNVVNAKGRPFSRTRPTIYQAASSLRHDERFLAVETEVNRYGIRGGYHSILLYEPDETNPEVIELRREMNEE